MQHGHHTSTSTGSSTTPTHIQAVPVGSYFSVQIPILVILGKNPHGMLSFRGCIIHAILFQVNTIKLVHLYT